MNDEQRPPANLDTSVRMSRRELDAVIARTVDETRRSQWGGFFAGLIILFIGLFIGSLAVRDQIRDATASMRMEIDELRYELAQVQSERDRLMQTATVPTGVSVDINPVIEPTPSTPTTVAAETLPPVQHPAHSDLTTGPLAHSSSPAKSAPPRPSPTTQRPTTQQPLARPTLDPSHPVHLERALLAAQAEVASQQHQLSRAQSLYEQGFASSAEVTKAETDLATAEAALERLTKASMVGKSGASEAPEGVQLAIPRDRKATPNTDRPRQKGVTISAPVTRQYHPRRTPVAAVSFSRRRSIEASPIATGPAGPTISVLR